MQLGFNLATKEQLHYAWAFAASPAPVRRRSLLRGSQHLNRAIITACSKQAKALGIKAGMRYEEAKLLIPDLKVFVYSR